MATDSPTSGPGDRVAPSRGAKRGDPFAELWEEATGGDEAEAGSTAVTTATPVAREGRPAPGATPPSGGSRNRPTNGGGRAARKASVEVPESTTDDSGNRAEGGRRRAGRVPIRARQVQRIIRRVDSWSVLKTALLFYLSVWLVVLLAGTILWLGAASTGMIDNVEKFIRELGGWEVFEFQAGELLRGVGLGGLLLVIFGSIFTALLSVIFNLIADLTGGIRVHVVEVERARRAD